jgi:putative sigma-54 modulation protein
MHISIRGHHLVITPAIEEKIIAQFGKLTQHIDHVCSLQVKLKKDHRLHTLSHKGQDNLSAEVIMRLPGKELFAQVCADDMYHAISLLVEKTRRQIERLDRHKDSKFVA